MIFFKKIIAYFFSNKLIKGTLILSIGSIGAGIINYIYHFLMGRMLGPTAYGILSSLISLSYILNIPIGTMNLVLVRFISIMKGRENLEEIACLFRLLNKKTLFFSLFILFFLTLFSPFINSFLHLSSSLNYFFVLIIFFISIFLTINQSFLQGLLHFGYLSLSGILGAILKFISAIVLVIFGFRVNGALGGILLGLIVSWLIAFLPLKFMYKGKNLRLNLKLNIKKNEIFKFTIPVFFSNLAFILLFTSDVVLVRHFFPDVQSGLYAALSTLGKIIYFLANPAITVMFPMISEYHTRGDQYKNLFLMSVVFISLVCLFSIAIYFIFPSILIKIFYGSQFLDAAKYLGYFSIFLSFYCLSFLLINFFLSIGETKPVIFSVLAAFGQIFLIFLFHQSLWQIIFISISLTALLTTSLLIYYFTTKVYVTAKEK